ncbi:hypothetical protein GRF59_09450 [Paenibacillus sp. HJL G12]|uniref:HTH araC/xylS-type domain-containing protein n=1 Tax=Paenibacillus dendrobii TaxID=2691084 RepID=A0A7X3IH58_9BACL|nr:helix-turn-helix transcriptional regulator [Paenibacillus dendrobii]MWV43859.1 hypothetical protein [Paenibacillus dendrobii]
MSGYLDLAEMACMEPGCFYRQFKKYAGVSPTEFRNMLKTAGYRDEVLDVVAY